MRLMVVKFLGFGIYYKCSKSYKVDAGREHFPEIQPLGVAMKAQQRTTGFFMIGGFMLLCTILWQPTRPLDILEELIPCAATYHSHLPYPFYPDRA
jgi:hypothetical protein